jgi:hypothetical protein
MAAAGMRSALREVSVVWRRRVPISAAIALLLLAGCNRAVAPAEQAAAPAAAPPSPVQSVAPSPPLPPSPPPPPPRLAARKPAPGETVVATAGAAREIRIIGLDEIELRALLGPPESEELHAPGKILRYGGVHCRLSVALYPEVQTRIFKALSYEVTGDDITPEGRRVCLAELSVGRGK